MNLFEIIFSSDLVAAALVYTIATLVALPLLIRVRSMLPHPVLHWNWDHIVAPLCQVVLLLLFLVIAYPVIFGITEAPAIGVLLSREELRINTLVNLLFIVSLLVPLLPGAVNWHALILPLQGIAAAMLLFSWLAAEYGMHNVSYWPGLTTIAYLAVYSILTYRLATSLAHQAGRWLDEKFTVLDSEVLVSRCIILFLQAPGILLYSLHVGRQLP